MGKRGPKPRPPSARNLQVVADFKAGMTYDEVGVKHGITKQRVQQILIALGAHTPGVTRSPRSTKECVPS